MSATPDEIRSLFDQLADMPTAGRLQPAAAGKVIEGTSFFPGGWGLWDAPKNNHFRVNGILVLGHTWGTQAYFGKAQNRGAEVQVGPAAAKRKIPPGGT